MINGEYRNNNNTLSSDDEISLAVRKIFKFFLTVTFNIVSSYKKGALNQRHSVTSCKLPVVNSKYIPLQCRRKSWHKWNECWSWSRISIKHAA